MHSGMQASAEALAAFSGVPDIAWDLGHESAGTEHLLLALIRSAPELFHPYCEPAELERMVLLLSPPTRPLEGEQPGEIPCTPAYVHAVKLAFAEAGREGCSHLQLVHVVLGLIDEPTGVASSALQEVGIVSRDDWVSDSDD